MTALPREVPWRRAAPRALPYTLMRIVDGTMETTFDRKAYRSDQQAIATSDLLDHLEHLRFLAVDYADHPSDSRKVAEIQIKELLAELNRRKELIATGDELAPRWPERASLAPRIEAVKRAWPIDRMVETLMGVPLQRCGNPDRRKGLCPLHEERTPSFYVDVRRGIFHCFGCDTHGDVIDLAGYQFGLDRTIDKIAALERWGHVTGETA